MGSLFLKIVEKLKFNDVFHSGLIPALAFIAFFFKSGLLFFEFNKGHIWFNRIINNKWYKIDSISGITNINKPNIDSNGYLIVIDDKILYNEIYYYLKYITSNPSLDLSYIQLYYCIKIIKLKKIENDNDYNFKIYLLNKIKEHLTIFIKLNNINKNTKSIKQKILHCIKLFNSNI